MWGLRTPRSKLPSESKPGWRFRSLYWAMKLISVKNRIYCTTPYQTNTHISGTELYRPLDLGFEPWRSCAPQQVQPRQNVKKKTKLNGRGTSHWCSHSSCQAVLEMPASLSWTNSEGMQLAPNKNHTWTTVYSVGFDESAWNDKSKITKYVRMQIFILYAQMRQTNTSWFQLANDITNRRKFK